MLSSKITPLRDDLHHLCHLSAHKPQEEDRLSTSHQGLNHFLANGLAYGQLMEWGIPLGSGGRALIMPLLAAATQKGQWCLWVYDQPELDIYPPAWQAWGVQLSYLRATCCGPTAHRYSDAVKVLKAILMSSFFKIIIIDSHISPQDYMFLSRRARVQKQLIVVIRKHFLSPKMGNIWAKTRFNGWVEQLHQRFYIRSIKGPGKGCGPKQICLSLVEASTVQEFLP